MRTWTSVVRQRRFLRLYDLVVPDQSSLAGVVLRVWATPRSSPERIGRIAGGCIRAHVSPPPERGKANARLIALLAKLLGVPRTSIEILSGTSHPRKLVRVAGCTEADVAALIPQLRGGHYVGTPGAQRRGRARALKRAQAAKSG